jgi:hypothetical protein
MVRVNTDDPAALVEERERADDGAAATSSFNMQATISIQLD